MLAGTLLAFVVSSTLGIGGGVLMLPPMLAVFDTPTAIAMIAPPMLVNGLVKLWVFRRSLDLRAALCLGALGWPLALVSGHFIDQVDPRVLKGLIVLLIGGTLALEHGVKRRVHVSARSLGGWGAATGVFAGLTGVSGPTLALSLKGYGVTGKSFVATVAMVVIGLQALRLPGYVARGVLPSSLLPLVALVTVIAAVAVLIGRALQARMSPTRWRLGLDLLLAGIGSFLALDVVKSFLT